MNIKKDSIQNEALRYWVENDKIGTCEIITGLGKTFLALKALSTYPRYQKDTIHLFLAEQIDRKQDLLKDIEKYNAIYKRNILEEYNLQFHCYQTVRNWKGKKFGLIIADEIHDSISPENCKFYFNNVHNGILGLTAKFKGDQYYNFAEDLTILTIFKKVFISKKEILDIICPIVYTYDLNKGQIDNTARKLKIFILENELECLDRTVKINTKKGKVFYQTEKAHYLYLNKKINDEINKTPHKNQDLYEFSENQNLNILKYASKRSKFLYNLESKKNLLEEFLYLFKKPTIIFGNSIEALKEFTPYVVSSKKNENENKDIRKKFDNGEIDLIGSFKKLKQGANLNGVHNCIIHSYYSSEIDFIQRIGRLRQDNDKLGYVIILVTKDTQEEIWLEKMMNDLNTFEVKRLTLDQFMDGKYYKDM